MTDTMSCPKCNFALADTAMTCPRCAWAPGKPPKPGPSTFKKLLLGAAGLAIASVVCLAGIGSSVESSSSSGSISEPPAQESPPPLVVVSARELLAAYKANEVSADDAYKGRHLQVTGNVASIDKDLFGHIIVKLGVNRFETVDATMLPSERAVAGRLAKGSEITVLCTGNGMIVMSPMLEDCRFQ